MAIATAKTATLTSEPKTEPKTADSAFEVVGDVCVSPDALCS